MRRYRTQTLLSLLAISSVTACGGGGATTAATADNPAPVMTPSVTPPVTPPSATPPPPATTPPTASSAMTMACVDGPSYQCSGSSIIKSENGIALTRSGVQAYGKSTSDLANPIPDVTTASGFALASGGTAEIRLAKDGNGVISAPAMLLSNLGLTWDGKNERPQIIETFRTTQGRVQLDANGALTSAALPDSSNLAFFDFAYKGAGATQQNYANNSYFPRTAPSRCPSTMAPPCPTTDSTGMRYQSGNWRTGGSTPSTANVERVHNDGDVHAGNGKPDANGNPTYLPGATGFGVPYPGSKGIRSLDDWSFQYSNLSSWITQDTVLIYDWNGGNEHNKIRRGFVSFGDTTAPNTVPDKGTASYAGVAYGWYASKASETPVLFTGPASMTVDFSTRIAKVTVQNTVKNDGSGTPVPVTFQATATMGASGGDQTNYLTGPVNNGTLQGGLSGRYYGPAVATGPGGMGPLELGGAFSLSNATSGAAVVGGFIARKQ